MRDPSFFCVIIDPTYTSAGLGVELGSLKSVGGQSCSGEISIVRAVEGVATIPKP